MTQVKLLDATNVFDLEKQINAFLAEIELKNILDIKHNMLTDPAAENQIYATAMIVYED